jgi:gluconokinase
MPSVSLAVAEAPLALALDVGSSSVRALLFDRLGRAVVDSEEQIGHSLRTTADGGADADANALFDILQRCIDGALARSGRRSFEIAAVGASCFWHSLLGLDDRGEPATPVFMWADTRAADQAIRLRQQLDIAAIHAHTGVVPHSSFWPAKLRWLHEAQPELVSRVAHWCSFAEYADLRLHGQARVSLSMASGTGLLDVHRLSWDDEALAIAGVGADKLFPLIDRDDAYIGLLPDYAQRWEALRSVPWYPALGDGACANVGTTGFSPRRLALTVGTSGALRAVESVVPSMLPLGLWSYRVDRDHYLLGGAISNGGILLAWLRDLLRIDNRDALERAVADLPPDSHGLTLLPFVAGERAPAWRDGLTGVVAGLTLHTRPDHLLRAAMESVAYRLALIYDLLKAVVPSDHELVANGGAILPSATWLTILADVLGHDLQTLPPKEEASARGAAILALNAAGHIPDLASLPDPAAGAPLYQPDAARHRRYRLGLDRQARLDSILTQWENDAS